MALWSSLPNDPAVNENNVTIGTGFRISILLFMAVNNKQDKFYQPLLLPTSYVYQGQQIEIFDIHDITYYIIIILIYNNYIIIYDNIQLL